jgi:ATP-binding cassette subfamily F protein uup
LHALRKQRRERRAAVGTVRLEIARGELSGQLVVVAEEVTKAYGDRAIVRDFSSRILRGDRVGIVGPNGAGKTTLLNLLTGALTPDAGEVRLGTNLAQVTLDQRRETLDPTQTLVQALAGGQGDTVTIGGVNRHVIGYMKDFLFGPEQANTPVGVLSGGERGRLTLARAFARPSNLLVLDEPTNDLDLETLDLLQERLAEYPGTVLLVSHDRDFLDRVVTSVIATEGDGRWIEYAGGYSDMLAQRGSATAAPMQALTKPRITTEDRPQRASASRRMTFKDRHALNTLPARIANLHADVGRLNAALADADLYTRDPARFSATTKALEAAQTALTVAEEQWLTLEMLREELEG